MRVATYNVENLFNRSIILNMKDRAESQHLLSLVQALQNLLDNTQYTPEVKRQIEAVSEQLFGFIDVRADIGGLGSWPDEGRPGPYRLKRHIAGRADWTGEITFKNTLLNDEQRMNTARVIQAMNADLLCVTEAEGMAALDNFNRNALKGFYKEFALIDTVNDVRGIDVGCFSNFAIKSLRTHMFKRRKTIDAPLFSRDCLQVEVATPQGARIHMLCNHFKSQRGKTDEDKAASAAWRREQAEAVRDIALEFNLDKEFVVVAGDLNEDTSTEFQSLQSLFDCDGLVPIVDHRLPMTERFTHVTFDPRWRKHKVSQLDYLFVSRALAERLQGHGFERRGCYELNAYADEIGIAPVVLFPEVTSEAVTASDHSGLWADFDVV
jgi:endonuclease/exonuclease/phosphatase family metal-dependent hydrolase